jgi:hypothetical protein
MAVNLPTEPTGLAVTVLPTPLRLTASLSASRPLLLTPVVRSVPPDEVMARPAVQQVQRQQELTSGPQLAVRQH